MNIDSFRQTPIGGSTPLKRKYAMEEDFLEISGVPGSDSLIDSSNDGISESSRVVTPFSVLRYHEPVSVDVVDGNKRSERLARNSRSTPSWLDFHEKLASRRAWTDEEDKKLRELTRNLSDQHNRWAVIADSMFGRTNKQCRERYRNHLAPALKNGDFTAEEDAIIVNLQQKYGNRWSKFLPFLPERTDNAVKNRYHVIRRAIVGGRPVAMSTDSLPEMSIDPWEPKAKKVKKESKAKGKQHKEKKEKTEVVIQVTPMPRNVRTSSSSVKANAHASVNSESNNGSSSSSSRRGSNERWFGCSYARIMWFGA